MTPLLPSVARLGLGLFTLAALAYLAGSARVRPAAPGRRLREAAALGAAALVLGLCWALAPRLLWQLAAALCLGLAAGLGLLTVRALGRLSGAREAATARLADTLERWTGESPTPVVARGALSGDPACLAPLTRRPCLRYRLEVSRGPPQGPLELVFLEEGGSERLVLRDGGAQLVLAAGSALPRDAGALDALFEGEVEAGEILETASPRRPIARLAKRFDPGLPTTGRFRYRFCEHSVPQPARVRAAGSLERREGAPTLVPSETRFEAEGEPAAELSRLQRCARRHAAAGAGALLASGLWLLVG